MCTQITPFGLGEGPHISGEEDCLYLNVWTPRLEPDQLTEASLPVMVWIHGGGNTVGTSDGAFGFHLAGTRDVAVVTLQYRLGLFGWLSHWALRDTASTRLDQTSNFAVLDMVAALQWVQDNIAAFGGDPNRVTLFGQSAGGLDINLLLASPQAKGLFHRAIIQSGSLRTTPQTLAENFSDDAHPGLEFSAAELVNKLLIQAGQAPDRTRAKQLQREMPAQELATFLRQQSIEQLMSAVKPRDNLGYYIPLSIRDGIVVPDSPLLEVFSDPSRYNKVPLIIGSNRDEYKFFLWLMPSFADKRWGILPDVRDFDRYNRTAAYFSNSWEVTAVNEPAQVLSQSQPGAVFAYRFDWDDQKPRLGIDMQAVFGAAHGLEIPFILGADAVDYLGLFTQPRDTQQKQALTDVMMDYWASFARYGKPGTGGDDSRPRWTAWNATGEAAKLLFDIPVDRGVTLSHTIITRDTLTRRLREDPYLSERERCERFAQLFYYSFNSNAWSKQAYSGFGCADYPLTGFSEL